MEKENTQQPVIPKGFKGLTKDMTTSFRYKDTPTYELGKVYYKDNIENPKLCSSDGYHYCDELQKVFSFYKNDGENRFFEIDVLGNSSTDKTKSITTAFRLVREIPKEEVDAITNKAEEERRKKELLENMGFEKMKWLQEKYPHAIVGGSFALILHGVTKNVERLKNNAIGDFDIILPFWELIESDDKKIQVHIDEEEAEMSGDDYEYVLRIDGYKTDVRIDPKARYEKIDFNGFTFKVARLETILQAKLKYGGRKHLTDVYQMVGKVSSKKVQSTDEDDSGIPF